MKTTVMMLALVVGGCATAEAQAVSTFGDLWMHLKSEDKIFVTDGSGRETSGVFAKASDSTLTILVDGALLDLPETDVRQIARRGDSVLNGFLIGAGIGAVFDGVVAASCDDEVYDCVHPAAAAAIGGLVFGGIGALIDYFIKGRTVVFRVKTTALRLQPSVTLGQRGLSASMVFRAN